MKKLFTLLTLFILSTRIYALSVTFNVNMTGQDVSGGVFIVGTVNGWVHTAMTDANADMIYTVTLDLAVNDYVYYYTTKTDWSAAARETLPAECASYSLNYRGSATPWSGDRYIDVKGSLAINLDHKFSACNGVTQYKLIQNTDISISPNPTSGLLRVKGIEDLSNVSIEITNASGKKLKQLKITRVNSDTPLDLSYLPKGVYMVKISSTQKIVSKKIVIE